MNASRFFLRAANALVTVVIVLALVIAGLYSVYALWDNHQVFAAATNVQDDMLKLKPDIENLNDGGPSFEELLNVNPDVCAWVTLDNTNIDYPVLQGETNLTYINTDVYGNFALAGSIFLDSRNSRDFSDAYNLLYGHHMADSNMFGDLDLYKEKDFFDVNTTGTLITPDRVYNLEIYACLVVGAGEDNIFDPERWLGDMNSLLDYSQQEALYIHQDTLTNIRQNPDVQILALSTCSSEFTDARTIILAVMRPR